MIAGTFSILHLGCDGFDITFARHDIPYGGSVRAWRVWGEEALKAFMAKFDVRITRDPIAGMPRGGFGERFVSTTTYNRHFQ
jgi:hypothetical protein